MSSIGAIQSTIPVQRSNENSSKAEVKNSDRGDVSPNKSDSYTPAKGGNPPTSVYTKNGVVETGVEKNQGTALQESFDKSQAHFEDYIKDLIVRINSGGEIKDFEVLPEEEWSAETISGNIVDFAESLLSSGAMSEEEYNKLKDGIEEGFKQAREILGELPSETNELIDNTFNMTMEKLDELAEKYGYIVAEDEENEEEVPLNEEETEVTSSENMAE